MGEKKREDDIKKELVKLGGLQMDGGQRNNIKRDLALNAYTLGPIFDVAFISLQNSIDALRSDRAKPDILKERVC